MNKTRPFQAPLFLSLFVLSFFLGNELNAADDLTATVNVISDYNGEDISCVDACDGIAGVTAVGGTTPYTYLWSDGQLAQVAIGLCEGTYTVIVTDATGCADTVSITLDDPPALSVSAVPFEYVTGFNISCPGFSDGEVTATASGGVGAYSYLWSNTQTTATAIGIPSAGLAIVVTDGNGCTAFDSLWINEPDAFSADSSIVLDLSCSPNIDGQIDLEISGGNGSYAYSWADGPATPDRFNLTAGNYTVTVTDILGCTFDASFDIEEADPIAATFAITDESCENNLDGAIDLSVSGGTAPYSFVWRHGATVEDPIALEKGIYELTIMDDRGCFSTAAATVGRSSQLVVSSLLEKPPCGSETGTISLNVTGADGALNYAWSDGQTTATAENLAAGEYSVLVMDASCALSRDFNLGNSQPVSMMIDKTPSACGEDNGSLTVTPIGEGAPFSYLWSDGQTTQTATNLGVDRYSVRITSIEGCLTYGLSSINELNDLSSTLNVSNPTSCGYNDGWMELSVSGGIPPYSYDWSTTSDSTKSIGMRSGRYWCTITDLAGCEYFAFAKLEDGAAPEINLETTFTDCSLNTGTVSSFISGGITPYEFNWSVNATLPNLTGQPQGVGILYLTDAAACLQTAPYLVSGSKGLIVEAESTGISCESFQDGSVELDVMQGLPNFSYNWSDGSSDSTISGLAAGSIMVEILDAANCLVTNEITVGDDCDLQLDAIFDTYSVLEGQANNLDILENDIFPSRGGVSISIIDNPSAGLVEGADLQTVDYSPDFNFTGEDSFTYALCDFASFCDTTTVYLQIKPQFALPEAFSPNNDGLNDFFDVRGISEFPDNELVVMNRWGDEVFRKKAYEGDWDGTYKDGGELPDGTYYYVLDLQNGEDPFAGYIVLQR